MTKIGARVLDNLTTGVWFTGLVIISSIWTNSESKATLWCKMPHPPCYHYCFPSKDRSSFRTKGRKATHQPQREGRVESEGYSLEVSWPGQGENAYRPSHQGWNVLLWSRLSDRPGGAKVWKVSHFTQFGRTTPIILYLNCLLHNSPVSWDVSRLGSYPVSYLRFTATYIYINAQVVICICSIYSYTLTRTHLHIHLHLHLHIHTHINK